MLIGLPHIDYIESSQTLLYSNNAPYHENNIHSAILTATNDAVDEWNALAQERNSNIPFTLTSNDSFCDVDDPYGYLSRLLSKSVLNNFNSNGVPTHVLCLKVNDICLIARSMKSVGLATNTRRIVSGRDLDDSNMPTILIPKIRFKFRLKYGQSYKVMRVQ